MGRGVFNPGSTYAKLVRLTHPSRTRLESWFFKAQHHSLCMAINHLRKLGSLCVDSHRLRV